jgi:CheY-like chemotaxis protein
VAARAAIDEASGEGAPVQLILLDESAPEEGATRWAQARDSRNADACPIILFSESPEALDGDALRVAGIGQVLPKPVVASHLMEAILEQMGVSAEGLASTADTLLKKISPRKILLAEDSRLIQKVMTGFLENWGHQVTVAENGRVALECRRSGDFDLILMDVEMPEMDGLAATAAIRAHEGEGQRIPIIALTAEARAEDRARCLAAGMDDYLAKPADPKQLYALIQRIPARVLATGPEGEPPEA